LECVGVCVGGERRVWVCGWGGNMAHAQLPTRGPSCSAAGGDRARVRLAWGLHGVRTASRALLVQDAP
jgi:hypothetical protein